MTQVAAVLLAAGEGSRVDGHTPKPLLELGGRALVDWAVDAIMATELRPVVMVVGHEGPAVAAHAPAGAQVVHAKSWKHGIAKSLGAALQALDPFVQVSDTVDSLLKLGLSAGDLAAVTRDNALRLFPRLQAA